MTITIDSPLCPTCGGADSQCETCGGRGRVEAAESAEAHAAEDMRGYLEELERKLDAALDGHAELLAELTTLEARIATQEVRSVAEVDALSVRIAALEAAVPEVPA